MQKIAILVLSLSLAACATDEESARNPNGSPGAPTRGDVAAIDETFNGDSASTAIQRASFDDGRIDWAEELEDETLLHSFDPKLAVDHVTVVDLNGTVVARRVVPTEIAHAGLK
jgi:hypothetical protein